MLLGLLHCSAHADAKGIMQLIRQVAQLLSSLPQPHLSHCLVLQAGPKSAMLVHGEAAKMDFLRQKVMQEFGIHCYMPANGEMVTIATNPVVPMDMSRLLLKRALEQYHGEERRPGGQWGRASGVRMAEHSLLQFLLLRECALCQTLQQCLACW